MEKRKLVLTIIGVVILAMVIMVYIYFSKPGKDEKKNQQTINQVQTVQQKTNEKKENTEKNTSGDELENVTPGSEEYRGFLLDNVLHSPNEGDIHYNVYIPDAYDGTKEYALYVTLPGYQGLYFQGVGENIRTEDFGFEAQKYITDMIIVAPQLNDWGQTSADQTIELTQYFLTHYIINPSKVYINGYSGGGETLSLVLAKQPELYTAALMCSSQWDGAYEPVVEIKTPVYFVIGESDEYYGSEPFKKAYQQIHELYKEQGLSESEIDKLVVLDVKDKDYFEGTPVTYQHGGGYLFCRDKEIMGCGIRHAVRIAVIGLKDTPGVAFRLFDVLAKKNINVDVILQSIGRAGTKDISFTVDDKDLDDAMAVLDENKARLGYQELHSERNIAKLSIVGAGMMSNPGVAAKMFESLYNEGVNINMISTSEIRVTVLINEKDGVRAMNAVHDAFNLAD